MSLRLQPQQMRSSWPMGYGSPYGFQQPMRQSPFSGGTGFNLADTFMLMSAMRSGGMGGMGGMNPMGAMGDMSALQDLLQLVMLAMTAAQRMNNNPGRQQNPSLSPPGGSSPWSDQRRVNPGSWNPRPNNPGYSPNPPQNPDSPNAPADPKAPNSPTGPNGPNGPSANVAPPGEMPGSNNTSQRLARSAENVARRMGTVGWCCRGVKQAVAQATGVQLQGGSAYQAADQLARSGRFREVNVSPSQLRNLPPGAVVVWGRTGASPHGHISVSLGGGREASDHIQRQMTSLRGHTNFRVFIPSD